MLELKLIAGQPPDNAEGMDETGKVLSFPTHRAPRLQALSDDQMARLVWLLNQTELLEKFLRVDYPKIRHECPMARAIFTD